MDVDLRAWVVEEHRATLERFDRSIAGVVPRVHWLAAAGTGGSSIAFLLFHTSYHEDVAVNAVLGAGEPVIADRRSVLGLDGFAASAGLAEAEDRALSAALDLDQLDAYVRAVHDRTAAWLSSNAATLEGTPDSSAGLTSAGIAEADVAWLYAMWRAQPASWFVQWEAIGHRINHLGEMVSVRNRLGLSPF